MVVKTRNQGIKLMSLLFSKRVGMFSIEKIFRIVYSGIDVFGRFFGA